LENAIYEDARFMMERMSREIRNNAIDYEEYFNKNYTPDGTNPFEYGHLYGCYAAQFYNPGKNLAAGDDSLGALCNDGSAVTGTSSCTIYRPSLDINTGVNPFVGRSGSLLASDASAFCSNTSLGNKVKDCTTPGSNLVDELYLIDKTGRTKTIFAKKETNTTPEHALAVVKLNGEDADINGNSDGIFQKWQGCSSGANQFCCASGFDCAGIASVESTLGSAAGLYKGFVPISPLRTDVVNLSFIVTPVEDPRKAFAETDILAQPKVTITLTVKPSASELSKYDGMEVPEITLQTTISSRIQSEVKSYTGVLPADCPY